MEMKDRIREIMESKHMTQQVFADFIQQSPATLSSIFNGRTRPTLNTVEAIKKKIPDINTDWLMFGTGDMYVSASDVQKTDMGLNAENFEEPILNFDAPASPTPSYPSSASPNSYSVRNTPQKIVHEEIKYIDKPARKVTEIRVYYDDQTWESFVPAKSK